MEGYFSIQNYLASSPSKDMDANASVTSYTAHFSVVSETLSKKKLLKGHGRAESSRPMSGKLSEITNQL